MKCVAALTTVLATASAFAPTAKVSTGSALKSYENELGVVDPTGYFGK
jgi:hypothetical protein